MSYYQAISFDISMTDHVCGGGCGCDEEHGHGTPINPQLTAESAREIDLVVNNDNGAADNTSTSNSMEIGDTFFGELDFVGDWDWIAIDLSEGQTITVDMDGITLQNSLLSIYNSEGELIAQNNQANGTFINDSSIDFTAFYDGTYYIVADSYQYSYAGTYTIDVNLAPEPATFDVLDALYWGSQLSSNEVNVYFAPVGYSVTERDENGNLVETDAEGFTQYEIQQFELAFEMISDVADLEFNYVSSDANADFILIGDADLTGVLGYFYPPGEGTSLGLSGVGVFATGEWDRFPGGDLEVGGNGHATVVHEILHGLGLAHPHDTGGGSAAVFQGVVELFYDLGDFSLNQGVFTTMSYNAGLLNGAIGAVTDLTTDYGVQAGPMALDIAVLQEFYGANTTHANGNDTYLIPTSNGGGNAWFAIWDTDGADEIVYNGSADAQIDLRAATLDGDFGGGGYLSGADGISGGFTIANGVVIEDAITGSGDDLLIGNNADNYLDANGGNDTAYSGKGDDLLEMGSGNDNAWGGSGDDVIYGGSGNDFLRGSTDFDEIYGGTGVDQLRGQKHNDMLYGGNDNDNLNGGGGNDTLFGDDGNDYIKGGSRKDYMEGGDGDDDLYGNSFDDSLYGGAGNDLLNGGGQNDIIDGGSGNDELKGGSGADTFIFDSGSGMDTIVDLDPFSDVIEISAALANGQTVTDIIDNANEGVAGTTLSMDDGSTIYIDGVVDKSMLEDAILIV